MFAQNMNTTRTIKPHHIELSKKFVDRCLAESQAWIKSSTYYHSDFLFDILLKAAVKKTSIENICFGSPQLPSPDTVMAMLAQTHLLKSRDELETQVSQLYQAQVSRHVMFKHHRMPKVILAIDLHDEEYYGKHLFDGEKRVTMFSQSKHRNALRFGTLCIVSAQGQWSYPLTIGFVVNYLGQSRTEVVKRLLSQITLPIKIECLLIDGGFNDAELFEWLDHSNIRFVCRGRYGRKNAGKLNTCFQYRVGSKRYPTFGYLYARNTGNGKREVVFLLSNHKFSLGKIKNLYRKRFRIENTYRHAKLTKMRTSTSKIQLRWIMWALAHFLELVWELLRYIFKDLNYKSYFMRQMKFIDWVHGWLELALHPA